MKALVMRLDGPMISFGGVMVDQHGFTDRFPGTAMLTGLIGNALGWDHRDAHRLNQLQERIDFAARWDVTPHLMVDYQTVDLGQPKMIGYADRKIAGSVIGGWTTRGQPEHRAGGPAAKFGTHPRYRHYLIDGLLTVVLALNDEDIPDLDDIQHALQKPARPLFLGRKSCLPSRPLLDPDVPTVDGRDLLEMLRKVPVWNRSGSTADRPARVLACWPGELESPIRGEIQRVYDMRDWINQIPAGSRLRQEGIIEVGAV